MCLNDEELNKKLESCKEFVEYLKENKTFSKNDFKYEKYNYEINLFYRAFNKGKDNMKKELNNYIKNNNLIDENYKRILIEHLEFEVVRK